MARTFKQKHHQRVSKKGKVFTAGQSTAIGVAAFAGSKVGWHFAKRVARHAAERAVVNMAHTAVKMAFGKRMKLYGTRAIYSKPAVKARIGNTAMKVVRHTDADVYRFIRKTLVK